jgi:hypothetical protein
LDDKLKFHVLIIHQFEGGCEKRLGHFLLKKQCVVHILRNKFDNLCGLRAVIVGKSIADKSDNYDIIRDSRNNLQNQLAIQLANKLGFSISNSLVIEDLIKVEKYLKDYQFIIINGVLMSEIVYAVPYNLKKIILFYHDHHFDTVKSLPKFFSRAYFCDVCIKLYPNFNTHPCNDVCKKCKNRECQRISFK